MKPLLVALLGAVACTRTDPGSAGSPEAGALTIHDDAGIDLVALQVALGRRVDRAERVLAALPDTATRRSALVAGDAAKLQIALLETPAAAPSDAEARVAEFEHAVAAVK